MGSPGESGPSSARPNEHGWATGKAAQAAAFGFGSGGVLISFITDPIAFWAGLAVVALSIFAIGRIHLAEARGAWKARAWDARLSLPSAIILGLVTVSLFSIWRNRHPLPGPPTAKAIVAEMEKAGVFRHSPELKPVLRTTDPVAYASAPHTISVLQAPIPHVAPQVLVTCAHAATYPTVVPSDGLHLVQINRGFPEPWLVTGSMFNPGDKLSPAFADRTLVRCEVTSLSERAILRMQLAFGVRFIEDLRLGDHHETGQVLEEATGLLPEMTLSPAGSDRVTFYFLNLSPSWVQLIVPDLANAYEDQKKVKVAVVRGEDAKSSYLYLWPLSEATGGATVH